MKERLPKTLKKSRRKYNPSPRLRVGRDCIRDTLESLPHTTRYLLDKLCTLRHYNGMVFPSQATLADYLGVTVRTVQNHLNVLVSLGFIGKWYRHMRSSIYNIHPLFFDGYWREKLKHLFPILGSKKVFSIGLLIAFTGSSANAGIKGIIWTSFVRYLYKDNYLTSKPSRSWQQPLDNPDNWVRGVPPQPNSLTMAELDRIFDGQPALKVSVQTNESTTKLPQKGKAVYQVPEHILNIQSLNLTRAGQLLLVGIQKEGILYADQQIQEYRHKKPLNPFKLFLTIALEATGWDQTTLPLTAQIMAQEKIDPHTPPLKNNTINKPEQTLTTYHQKKAAEFLAILNKEATPVDPPETKTYPK